MLQETYIDFLHELRTALTWKFVISVRVRADVTLVGSVYNTAQINTYVDYINLKTYDLHDGSANDHTRFRSPLYGPARDKENINNIDAVVNAWIRTGIHSYKLLLGLALHAETYTLASTANNDLRAPISGPGRRGPYTNVSGILSNPELCIELHKGGWNIIYSDDQASVYAHKKDQWINYESPRSIKAKAEYAKSKKLGGMMLWSIDYEDVHFTCDDRRNPLVSAIWSIYS